MRIGIDIMGGDYAPKSTVSGSFLARNDIPEEVKLIFFGHKESIISECRDNGFDVNGIEIHHCDEVIGMDDHPYKAFFSRKNSSIYQGFSELKAGRIDAFCSAGNTGAMMIGATQVINSIPGIIRPAIAARFPNLKNKKTVLLDVGINPDSRPDVMYQHAILGQSYLRAINGSETPAVGLINIGQEEEKGNLTSKSAYQLMKDSADFNFVGNIEGHQILTNPPADVLVCDGFTGNIILKQTESFYHVVKSRKIEDDFFEMFNFENFGGTAILGINKPVIVGHGISNAKAIKNMILHSYEVVENNLVSRIKDSLE